MFLALSLHPLVFFHHCLASRDIYSLSDENTVSLFSPSLLHLNSIIHPKPMQEFIQANLLLKVWNLSNTFQLLIPPLRRKMRMTAGLWSGGASLTPMCWNKVGIRSFAASLEDKAPEVCSAGFTVRTHWASGRHPWGLGLGRGKVEGWDLGTC